MNPMPTLYRWMSPITQAVSRARHGVTLGVRVLATDFDDRIALVRHTYLDGWYLPGGGTEPAESAEDAARRELVEETGARLDDATFSVFGAYTNFEQMPGNHVLLYRAIRVKPGARQPDMEIAEVGWFPFEALPHDTTPATRRRLDEVLHGRTPSKRWRESTEMTFPG